MATWHASGDGFSSNRNAPWYVWCAVLAITSAMIGGHWDISWHTAIGRDTFWTPAHLAIYMCGVLAGISCGFLILRATFAREYAAGSVTVLGFRGPLGAFIAAWGGIAMLTSAPFDNWWHDAYGLDVKIVSPPHLVLLIGVFAVATGTLILTLGLMNRATEKLRRQLEWMFLYVGGLLVVLVLLILMEYVDRVLLHSALPYQLMAALLPLVIAGVWQASSHRFAATLITGFYSFFLIALILILPLFPAEPKLGPVYHNVTQFIPPQFPVLLIVPAFLLDLFWQRSTNWKKWQIAAVSGVIFVVALVAVEWPFASFLMTPASRNAFFGTGYLGYFVSPKSYLAQGLFANLDEGAQRMWNLSLAVVFAMVSTRIGLGWGTWMRKVRR